MIRRPDDRHRFVLEKTLAEALCVCLPLIALLVSPADARAQTAQEAPASQQKYGPNGDTFETWLLLAIDGDAEAQFNLGLLYSEGKGVQIDYKQAAFWYGKGAEQGHTGAQYNLAHLYLDGHGVEKNLVKAAYWWRQAAQRGHVLAQQYLGYAFFKGIGVAEDEDQALRWFREAAQGGDPRARKMLELIQRRDDSNSVGGDRASEPDTAANATATPPVDLGSTDAVSRARAGAPALLGPHDNPKPAFTRGDDLARWAVDHQAAGRSEAEFPALPKVSDASAFEVEHGNTDRADPPSVSQPATAAGESPSASSVDGVETFSADGADSNHSWEAETASVATESVPQPLNGNSDVNVDEPTPNRPDTAGPKQNNPRPVVLEQAPAELTPRLLANLNPSDRLSLPVASPTDDSKRDNENWLFAQPANFYTLQLISAPSLKVVNKFMNSIRLDDAKLLQTRIDGRLWWYLLYGSYPNIDAARAGVSTLGLGQSDVWIRRFGAVQVNRCHNLADTDARPSDYCRDNKAEDTPTKPRSRLGINGTDLPGLQSAVEAAPTSMQRSSTAPKQRSSKPVDQAPELSGLRSDDHHWLFSQPGDYYTVQLISVPQISQLARFLRENDLQDDAVYFTTRRDERDWFIALYGSHSDLRAAEQATKSLPVASGSIWIRQFASIQKRQCRIADQLPGHLPDSVNYYCEP